MKQDERILLLAAIGRDAALIAAFLQRQGIHSVPCRDIGELCREIGVGAGAVLITDESLDDWATDRLLNAIELQPAWSDLPLIIFPSNDRAGELLITALGPRANVTTFERPIRHAILLCAVQSALRARRRQYELHKVLERLEEADQQKDLFLATLSHELRTPLTSIVGWVQLLKTRTLDSQTFAKALDTIERNTYAQTRLIEDILSISKIIAGKLAIERKPVRLSDLVNGSLSTVGPQAEAKDINIKADIQGDDYVKGDAVRLQEVVWNLLSNAIKFTPAQGEVSVCLRRDGSMLRLTVTDTGRGIDPAVLPHIFEHFRQADSSNTRTAGGLGLGLAIARKLVELHDGVIEAISDGIDCGTTMMVALPIDEDDATSQRQALTALPEISSSLEGHSVLLVEDDIDSRRLLAYVLSDAGATVHEAETVGQALNLFRTRRPDVIVSDIGLAGENGYDLIEKIRLEEGNACRTPALALTGFADPRSQQRALAAGYQLHIAKPVQPEMVVDTIVGLLRTSSRA